jgi:hypothetical protein
MLSKSPIISNLQVPAEIANFQLSSNDSDSGGNRTSQDSMGGGGLAQGIARSRSASKTFGRSLSMHTPSPAPPGGNVSVGGTMDESMPQHQFFGGSSSSHRHREPSPVMDSSGVVVASASTTIQERYAQMAERQLSPTAVSTPTPAPLSTSSSPHIYSDPNTNTDINILGYNPRASLARASMGGASSPSRSMAERRLEIQQPRQASGSRAPPTVGTPENKENIAEREQTTDGNPTNSACSGNHRAAAVPSPSLTTSQINIDAQQVRLKNLHAKAESIRMQPKPRLRAPSISFKTVQKASSVDAAPNTTSPSAAATIQQQQASTAAANPSKSRAPTTTLQNTPPREAGQPALDRGNTRGGAKAAMSKIPRFGAGALRSSLEREKQQNQWSSATAGVSRTNGKLEVDGDGVPLMRFDMTEDASPGDAIAANRRGEGHGLPPDQRRRRTPSRQSTFQPKTSREAGAAQSRGHTRGRRSMGSLELTQTHALESRPLDDPSRSVDPSVGGGVAGQHRLNKPPKGQNQHSSQSLLAPPSGQVSSSSSRIRVVVRKRPLLKKELQKGERDCMDVQGAYVKLVENRRTVDLSEATEFHAFQFDSVYSHTETTQSIYEENVRPLLRSALEGNRSTCFAYGQTKSGKTFTMLGQGGKDPCAGTIQIAAQELFSLPKSRRPVIFVSFFEIYGGKLYDLLRSRAEVRCMEDYKGEIQLAGLAERKVGSFEEMMEFILQGQEQRSVGSTFSNQASSRSHAVLQWSFVRKSVSSMPGNKSSSLRKKYEIGRISFIDLAGSERGSERGKSSAINQQTRREGAEINKSLLALKECIRAIDKGQDHTPFRGSKLTMVLKESLVGGAKAVMIACVSPSTHSCNHSLNTLRYAEKIWQGSGSHHRAGKGTSSPTILPNPPPGASASLEEDLSSPLEDVLYEEPASPPPPSGLHRRVRSDGAVLHRAPTDTLEWAERSVSTRTRSAGETMVEDFDTRVPASVSSQQAQVVEVVFEKSGQLGIRFEQLDNPKIPAEVRAEYASYNAQSPSTSPRNKTELRVQSCIMGGQAEESGQVHAGALLLAVNGTFVDELPPTVPMQEVLSQRPLTLQFLMDSPEDVMPPRLPPAAKAKGTKGTVWDMIKMHRQFQMKQSELNKMEIQLLKTVDLSSAVRGGPRIEMGYLDRLDELLDEKLYSIDEFRKKAQKVLTSSSR